MRFSLKLAQSAQSGKRQSKFSTERQQFWCRSHLGKNAPNRDFKPKNAVEYLFTRSTDSHLQYTNGFSSTSGTRGIIRIFLNPFLGEQSGNFQESSLMNNFSTVQPIFTSNTLIDSAKQGE
jgi:hypothetical protein